MTYCLALRVDDGLVFASDTRTTAGADYVTSYSKTHVFEVGEDRRVVVCTAGNLSTTQEIVHRLRRDLAAGVPNSLSSFSHMWELANYVGQVSLDVQEFHSRGLSRTGASGAATLLFGGQIAGADPEIFLVYAEGNPITASSETPYLQIGESKYGKPILDRLATESLTLEQAATLAIVSLDATIKSNVTVGLPFDVTVLRRDMTGVQVSRRVEAQSDYMTELRSAWQEGQRRVFEQLPALPWAPVAAGPAPAQDPSATATATPTQTPASAPSTSSPPPQQQQG